MKQYLTNDPWCVVEDGFHPEHNEVTESLMSLGNGRLGGRGAWGAGREHAAGRAGRDVDAGGTAVVRANGSGQWLI